MQQIGCSIKSGKQISNKPSRWQVHEVCAQQQEGDLKDINRWLVNGACYGATSIANVADSPASMEFLTPQEIASEVNRLTEGR